MLQPRFQSNKRSFSNKKRLPPSSDSNSQDFKKSKVPSRPNNGRGKHGRNQLREITKVGRKRNFGNEEQEDIAAFDNYRGAESDDEIGGPGGNNGDSDIEGGEEAGLGKENQGTRQAYDALMVLLKSDQKAQRAKDKKKSKSEGVEEANDQLEREDDEGGHEEQEYDIEEEDEKKELENSKKEDLADLEDLSEDENNEDDNNDTENRDPFDYHFDRPSEGVLEKAEELFKSQPRVKWSAEKLNDKSYNLLEQFPPNDLDLSKSSTVSLLKSTSLPSLQQLKIKSRIMGSFVEHHGNELSALEQKIASPIFQYQDLVFPYQEYENESSVRDLYTLHAVNHVFKTRDRILKNNLKLSSFKEQIEQGKAPIDQEPEFRDQSFNRPKVLILLPTRNACYEVVEKLIAISNLASVENKKRFQNQYYSTDKVPEYKPEDFKYLFNGNSNDFFVLGVKFTRKTLKLYSAFNQSDLIFASPLGLKAILEKKEKNKNNKEFLSSIEVLIVDQANSLQYQNWANVSYILKHVNKIPENYGDDLDFSRIRMWAINNQFKLLRQNLVFCKFVTPEINNLVNNNSSLNLAGKCKYKKLFLRDTQKGASEKVSVPAIDKIVFKVRQTFNRFDCELPVNDPDARFNFFKSSTVPLLQEQSEDREEGGTLVYIPDYSDYLRVKKHLRFETSVNFCAVDEYTSQSKLTRYREGFNKGKYKVMLYTERLHHYNRFEIKGVKNVVFYKLPADEGYYAEVVLRFLGHSLMKEVIKDIRLSFVKVIYCQWDAVLLEKVVGSDKAPVLCYSANETYEFR